VEDELVDDAIQDGCVMDRNRILGSPLDGPEVESSNQ
jgi:hypothetical protein